MLARDCQAGIERDNPLGSSMPVTQTPAVP